MENKSTRVEYIDIFRGIGILLMIMGHVGFGKNFDYFIHAFHMPMFFFISGFLFKNNYTSFISFLCKRIKTLLVPYFFWGIFHYIIYSIIKKQFLEEPLKHLFYDNTEGLPICGALWFLTAIFIANIIYYWLNKIKNEILKWIIVMGIATIGTLSGKLFTEKMPFAMSASFVGIGLLHMGYKVNQIQNNKYISKFLNMQISTWLICSSIISGMIFCNGYVNMRTNMYSNIILFWINSLGACIIGINFSKFIEKYFNTTYTIKILKNMGKNSIVYVCLNQIVIQVIKKIVELFGVTGILKSLIVLFLVLGGVILVSEILLHTKLKVLFGKL